MSTCAGFGRRVGFCRKHTDPSGWVNGRCTDCRLRAVQKLIPLQEQFGSLLNRAPRYQPAYVMAAQNLGVIVQILRSRKKRCGRPSKITPQMLATMFSDLHNGVIQHGCRGKRALPIKTRTEVIQMVTRAAKSVGFTFKTANSHRAELCPVDLPPLPAPSIPIWKDFDGDVVVPGTTISSSTDKVCTVDGLDDFLDTPLRQYTDEEFDIASFLAGSPPTTSAL